MRLLSCRFLWEVSSQNGRPLEPHLCRLFLPVHQRKFPLRWLINFQTDIRVLAAASARLLVISAQLGAAFVRNLIWLRLAKLCPWSCLEKHLKRTRVHQYSVELDLRTLIAFASIPSPKITALNRPYELHLSELFHQLQGCIEFEV